MYSKAVDGAGSIQPDPVVFTTSALEAAGPLEVVHGKRAFLGIG